jgi:hypothetical protein
MSSEILNRDGLLRTVKYESESEADLSAEAAASEDDVEILSATLQVILIIINIYMFKLYKNEHNFVGFYIFHCISI